MLRIFNQFIRSPRIATKQLKCFSTNNEKLKWKCTELETNHTLKLPKHDLASNFSLSIVQLHFFILSACFWWFVFPFPKSAQNSLKLFSSGRINIVRIFCHGHYFGMRVFPFEMLCFFLSFDKFASIDCFIFFLCFFRFLTIRVRTFVRSLF